MLICGDAGIGRQASLRCLCQYWRVGSSPISRTSVKDIRFSSVLYFYISANQQSIISKKATLESYEIFDFVEAELVPQSDKASLRCLCQYWRVGSSPISRTIKGLQKRCSPRNPRFYRGFRRFYGRKNNKRFCRCEKDTFPFLK